MEQALFDLRGKRALITGSTQGIGLAIAELFSSYGAVTYINGGSALEKVSETVKKIPNAREAFCDLSQSNCADILYEKTGEIDILILCASIQYRSSWEEVTQEEYQKQTDINFRSSFFLIQKYAPSMQKHHFGRIVTVGSVQEALPKMPIYAATKAAQTNLMTYFAKTLAPDGITVNNIAPGVIHTPRNDSVLRDETSRKQVISGIPLGFVGTSADCAGLALLLCADAGRYITGESIYADGGMKL